MGLLDEFLYELYAEPVRKAFDEAFRNIYYPDGYRSSSSLTGLARDFASVVISWHSRDNANNSVVKYDKNKVTQRIKRNNIRYTTPILNRRLQTLRIQTHTMK